MSGPKTKIDCGQSSQAFVTSEELDILTGQGQSIATPLECECGEPSLTETLDYFTNAQTLIDQDEQLRLDSSVTKLFTPQMDGIEVRGDERPLSPLQRALVVAGSKDAVLERLKKFEGLVINDFLSSGRFNLTALDDKRIDQLKKDVSLAKENIEAIFKQAEELLASGRIDEEKLNEIEEALKLRLQAMTQVELLLAEVPALLVELKWTSDMPVFEIAVARLVDSLAAGDDENISARMEDAQTLIFYVLRAVQLEQLSAEYQRRLPLIVQSGEYPAIESKFIEGNPAVAQLTYTQKTEPERGNILASIFSGSASVQMGAALAGFEFRSSDAPPEPEGKAFVALACSLSLSCLMDPPDSLDSQDTSFWTEGERLLKADTPELFDLFDLNADSADPFEWMREKTEENDKLVAKADPAGFFQGLDDQSKWADMVRSTDDDISPALQSREEYVKDLESSIHHTRNAVAQTLFMVEDGKKPICLGGDEGIFPTPLPDSPLLCLTPNHVNPMEFLNGELKKAEGLIREYHKTGRLEDLVMAQELYSWVIQSEDMEKLPEEQAWAAEMVGTRAKVMLMPEAFKIVEAGIVAEIAGGVVGGAALLARLGRMRRVVKNIAWAYSFHKTLNALNDKPFIDPNLDAFSNIAKDLQGTAEMLAMKWTLGAAFKSWGVIAKNLNISGAAAMTGGFVSEFLGFTAYEIGLDYTYRSYEDADLKLVLPMPSIEKAFEANAMAHRAMFLGALKVAGVMASPITRPIEEFIKAKESGALYRKLQEFEKDAETVRREINKLASGEIEDVSSARELIDKASKLSERKAGLLKEIAQYASDPAMIGQTNEEYARIVHDRLLAKALSVKLDLLESGLPGAKLMETEFGPVVSFEPASLRTAEGKAFLDGLAKRGGRLEQVLKDSGRECYRMVLPTGEAVLFIPSESHVVSKNTVDIKAPELVADLKAGAEVKDKAFSFKEFAGIVANVIEMLAGRDAIWKNSYHNSPHGMDVYSRVTLFAKLLGLSKENTQALQFAALLHDYDHNGKTVRGDSSGLSNEEVAAIAADKLAKELGFSPRQRALIYGAIIGTTVGNPAIAPSTMMEQLLAVADIAGFTKPYDAWVNEGFRFIRELPEAARPRDIEGWVKFETGFLEKFVRPRIEALPAPVRDELLPQLNETLARVKEAMEPGSGSRKIVESELEALKTEHEKAKADAVLKKVEEKFGSGGDDMSVVVDLGEFIPEGTTPRKLAAGGVPVEERVKDLQTIVMPTGEDAISGVENYVELSMPKGVRSFFGVPFFNTLLATSGPTSVFFDISRSKEAAYIADGASTFGSKVLNNFDVVIIRHPEGAAEDVARFMTPGNGKSAVTLAAGEGKALTIVFSSEMDMADVNELADYYVEQASHHVDEYTGYWLGSATKGTKVASSSVAADPHAVAEDVVVSNRDGSVVITIPAGENTSKFLITDSTGNMVISTEEKNVRKTIPLNEVVIIKGNPDPGFGFGEVVKKSAHSSVADPIPVPGKGLVNARFPRLVTYTVEEDGAIIFEVPEKVSKKRVLEGKKTGEPSSNEVFTPEELVRRGFFEHVEVRFADGTREVYDITDERYLGVIVSSVRPELVEGREDEAIVSPSPLGERAGGEGEAVYLGGEAGFFLPFDLPARILDGIKWLFSKSQLVKPDPRTPSPPEGEGGGEGAPVKGDLSPGIIGDLFTNAGSIDFLRQTFPRDVRVTIDPVVELTKMIEAGDVNGAVEKVYKYFVNITDVLRSIANGADVEQFKDMAVVRLEEKAAAFDTFVKFLDAPENTALKGSLMAREKFADQFEKARVGLERYRECEAASGPKAKGLTQAQAPASAPAAGPSSPMRYELRKQYEAEFENASMAELIDHVEEMVGDAFGLGLRREFLALKGRETLIGLAAELRLAVEAKKEGEAPAISSYAAEVLNEGLPSRVKIMPDGSLKKPATGDMKKELASFLARLGITEEEMRPAIESLSERSTERIWFKYAEQTSDSGRFASISDGLGEVGYEIKITTEKTGEGLVKEFHLTEVESGFTDAVAISRGDKAALREGLRSGFQAKNSYNLDDAQVGTLFPPENFGRLGSTLGTLGAYLERGGRKPEDVTVCVAGHGSYDVYTILFLLKRGYRVVSRETGEVQGLMIRMFQAKAKEKYGVDLDAAVTSGQLVLSDYMRKGHPTEYDMVVWSHPQAGLDMGGIPSGSLPREKLTENLKDGGIFVVQSDAPELYVGPFEKDAGFEKLFTKEVYKNDSLLFSPNMMERGDRSRPSAKVGIFEKKPTEGDKSPSPLPAPSEVEGVGEGRLPADGVVAGDEGELVRPEPVEGQDVAQDFSPAKSELVKPDPVTEEVYSSWRSLSKYFARFSSAPEPVKKGFVDSLYNGKREDISLVLQAFGLSKNISDAYTELLFNSRCKTERLAGKVSYLVEDQQSIIEVTDKLGAMTEDSALEFLNIVKNEGTARSGEYLQSYDFIKEAAERADIEISPEDMRALVLGMVHQNAKVVRGNLLGAVSEAEMLRALIYRTRLLREWLGVGDANAPGEMSSVPFKPLARFGLSKELYINLEYGDYEAACGLQFTLYMKGSDGNSIRLGTVGFQVTGDAVQIVRYQGGDLSGKGYEAIRDKFREFSGGVDPLPWLALATAKGLQGMAMREGKNLLWIKGDYVAFGVPHELGELPEGIRSMEDVRAFWAKEHPELEELGIEYDRLQARVPELEEAVAKRRAEIEGIKYELGDHDKELAELQKNLKGVKNRIVRIKPLVETFRRGPHTAHLYNTTAENLGFRSVGKNKPWYRFTKDPALLGSNIRSNATDGQRLDEFLTTFDRSLETPSVVKTDEKGYTGEIDETKRGETSKNPFVEITELPKPDPTTNKTPSPPEGEGRGEGVPVIARSPVRPELMVSPSNHEGREDEAIVSPSPLGGEGRGEGKIVYLDGGLFGIDPRPALKQGWEFLRDGWKRFVSNYEPVIVATIHSGEASLARDKEQIKKARENGARKVGLEITPEALKTGSNPYFSELASYANELGMEVVPLIDAETHKRLMVFSMVTNHIGNDGKFAVEELEREINRVENEIGGVAYMSLEKAVAVMMRLSRLREVLGVINEAGADLNRFAELWEEGARVAVKTKMAEVVAREKPDVIIVGGFHAHDVAREARGYKLEDIQIEEHQNAVVMEIMDNVKMTAIGAEEIYGSMGAIVDEMALRRGVSLDAKEKDDLILDAIVGRPEAVALAVRARIADNPDLKVALNPTEHLNVLRLSCSEARRRVEEIFNERFQTAKGGTKGEAQFPSPLGGEGQGEGVPVDVPAKSEIVQPDPMNSGMKDPATATGSLVPVAKFPVTASIKDMAAGIPEVRVMVGMDQRSDHHSLTLDQHTDQVVVKLSEDPALANHPLRELIILAAKWHDIGKTHPDGQQVHKKDPAKRQYVGHEKVSARMIRELLPKYFKGMSVEEIEFVAGLAGLHASIFNLVSNFRRNNAPTGKELGPYDDFVAKLEEIPGQVSIEEKMRVILALNRADKLAGWNEKSDLNDPKVRAIVERARDEIKGLEALEQALPVLLKAIERRRSGEQTAGIKYDEASGGYRLAEPPKRQATALTNGQVDVVMKGIDRLGVPEDKRDAFVQALREGGLPGLGKAGFGRFIGQVKGLLDEAAASPTSEVETGGKPELPKSDPKTPSPLAGEGRGEGDKSQLVQPDPKPQELPALERQAERDRIEKRMLILNNPATGYVETRPNMGEAEGEYRSLEAWKYLFYKQVAQDAAKYPNFTSQELMERAYQVLERNGVLELLPNGLREEAVRYMRLTIEKAMALYPDETREWYSRRTEPFSGEGVFDSTVEAQYHLARTIMARHAGLPPLGLPSPVEQRAVLKLADKYFSPSPQPSPLKGEGENDGFFNYAKAQEAVRRNVEMESDAFKEFLSTATPEEKRLFLHTYFGVFAGRVVTNVGLAMRLGRLIGDAGMYREIGVSLDVTDGRFIAHFALGYINSVGGEGQVGLLHVHPQLFVDASGRVVGTSRDALAIDIDKAGLLDDLAILIPSQADLKNAIRGARLVKDNWQPGWGKTFFYDPATRTFTSWMVHPVGVFKLDVALDEAGNVQNVTAELGVKESVRSSKNYAPKSRGDAITVDGERILFTHSNLRSYNDIMKEFPMEFVPPAIGGASFTGPVEPVSQASPIKVFAMFEIGEGEMCRFPPSSDTAVLGRHSTSDIEIRDKLASRQHARVTREGNRYFIEDMSHNGTFVNGARISGRVELKDGDRVLIGETLLTFKARSVDDVIPPPATRPPQIVTKTEAELKASAMAARELPELFEILTSYQGGDIIIDGAQLPPREAARILQDALAGKISERDLPNLGWIEDAAGRLLGEIDKEMKAEFLEFNAMAHPFFSLSARPIQNHLADYQTTYRRFNELRSKYVPEGTSMREALAMFRQATEDIKHLPTNDGGAALIKYLNESPLRFKEQGIAKSAEVDIEKGESWISADEFGLDKKIQNVIDDKVIKAKARLIGFAGVDLSANKGRDSCRNRLTLALELKELQEKINAAKSPEDVIDIVLNSEFTSIGSVSIGNSTIKETIDKYTTTGEGLDNIPEFLGIRQRVKELVEEGGTNAPLFKADRSLPPKELLAEIDAYTANGGELHKYVLSLFKNGAPGLLKQFVDMVAGPRGLEKRFTPDGLWTAINDVLAGRRLFIEWIPREGHLRGLVERIMQTRIDAVKRLMAEEGKEWPEYSPFDGRRLNGSISNNYVFAMQYLRVKSGLPLEHFVSEEAKEVAIASVNKWTERKAQNFDEAREAIGRDIFSEEGLTSNLFWIEASEAERNAVIESFFGNKTSVEMDEADAYLAKELIGEGGFYREVRTDYEIKDGRLVTFLTIGDLYEVGAARGLFCNGHTHPRRIEKVLFGGHMDRGATIYIGEESRDHAYDDRLYRIFPSGNFKEKKDGSELYEGKRGDWEGDFFVLLHDVKRYIGKGYDKTVGQNRFYHDGRFWHKVTSFGGSSLMRFRPASNGKKAKMTVFWAIRPGVDAKDDKDVQMMTDRLKESAERAGAELEVREISYEELNRRAAFEVKEPPVDKGGGAKANGANGAKQASGRQRLSIAISWFVQYITGAKLDFKGLERADPAFLEMVEIELKKLKRGRELGQPIDIPQNVLEFLNDHLKGKKITADGSVIDDL